MLKPDSYKAGQTTGYIAYYDSHACVFDSELLASGNVAIALAAAAVAAAAAPMLWYRFYCRAAHISEGVPQSLRIEGSNISEFS